MKKDRNSFFQSSNFNMSASASSPMMPNYGMMPMQSLNPSVNAMSNQYYQANNIPLAYPYADNTMMNVNEIDARIAKLERAINRLDARINKLEGMTTYSNDTYNTDGNMYMV